MDNQNNNTFVESTRIEQSQQSLTEELSLKNITQILLQNWALFVVLFTVLMGAAGVAYKFKVPFQSNASIIINDNKNSSLQSFTSQFAGQASSSKVNEAKKANSSVQKNIEYLKTTEFYIKLIKSMTENKNVIEMTIPEKNGMDKFNSKVMNGKSISDMNVDEQIQVVRQLDGMMKLSLRSDYEIEVQVNSLDQELAYFISKNSISFLTAELKSIESADIKIWKDFLTQKKAALDESIHKLNQQLSDFQSRPENLLSLGASSVGEYISELMIRKNEIKMKISENNKIIETLEGGKRGRRDSALYGNSGKINTLKIENDMLSSKLAEVQNTVARVTSQAKSIPVAAMTYDELKKKSDVEFKDYKETSEILAKIDALELSLNNKFEVLESPRFDQVKPAIRLLTLFLLALILTQALGSLIIYLRTIWDTTYVTAQQTRNIVILDGHSLDPRVFIENSKIKFQLKNNSFDNEQKKIGFDFGTQKAVGGDNIKSDSTSSNDE